MLSSNTTIVHQSSDIRSYTIMDLGNGMGTFVQVIGKSIIQSGTTFVLGNTKMHVAISADTITCTVIADTINNQEFKFNNSQRTIKVGRSKDCEIMIENEDLSSYHCIITREHNGWAIEDGYKRKPSTNKTWIFADKDIPLRSGTVVRAGKVIIDCDLTCQRCI